MLKTTPLCGGSFGGYLLPHKGFQDAGTFSRLVGTTPLLRGTLTPLVLGAILHSKHFGEISAGVL